MNLWPNENHIAVHGHASEEHQPHKPLPGYFIAQITTAINMSYQ